MRFEITDLTGSDRSIGRIRMLALEGAVQLISSDVHLAAVSTTMKISFRISRSAERLVGQSQICVSMSGLLRALLSWDGRAGLARYDITEIETVGKPLNRRVEFAVRHAQRMMQGHNDLIEQLRLSSWYGARSRILPSHQSHEVEAPIAVVGISQSFRGIQLTPLADADVDAVDEMQECNLCMETSAVRGVTCCRGKLVCAPCVRRLFRCSPSPSPSLVPRCPWCRS